MICFDGGRIFRERIKNKSVVIWPATIVIDSMEQQPFDFLEMSAIEKGEIVPFVVKTKRERLATGDYTVDGFQDAVTIERKSFDDLYQTLAQRREAFTNQMERMSGLRFSAVVCEAPWPQVMRGQDGRKITPENIFSTVISFQVRFPNVQWWFCRGRRDAETVTFRLLKKFAESYQG